MSKVTLMLTGSSEPLTIEAHMLDQNRFLAIFPNDSESEPTKGELIYTSDCSGWLMLPNADDVESAACKVVPFYIISADKNDIIVWCAGQVTSLAKVSATAKRSGAGDNSAASHSGDIVAPLPGRVLKVLVAVGDSVEIGTPLVILESMKMETTLSSPLIGQVKQVRCESGGMVDKGMLLLALNASESSSA
jgi:biotin carboxyl carrier protein